MVSSEFPVLNKFLGSAAIISELACTLDIPTGVKGTFYAMAYAMVMEPEEMAKLAQHLVDHMGPEMQEAMHTVLQEARQ